MGEISERVYVHNWITWLYTWYLTHYCKSIKLKYKIAIKCKKIVNLHSVLFFSSPQIYSCPLIWRPKVMLDNGIILTLSAFGCSAWSPNSSSLTYHFLLVISTPLDTQHFPSTFYLLALLCPTLSHWFLWKFSLEW